jgi:N-acetylneuraminic acid mutarotase
MPRFLPLLLVLLTPHLGASDERQRLPSLPDKQGFASPFAGVSNGSLLVGGGANFPGKKPWEGGKKVWYDDVFVLEKPHGEWKQAGKLPRPLGYGVSVSHRESVVCVGGSDAERHYPDAFHLAWKGGKLITTRLPSLPRPAANACGAVVGDVLYVAGGLEKPDAKETLRGVYRLDLTQADAKWQAIEELPGGGRMLAVAAGFEGSFWVIGGVDLVAKGEATERRYLKDAYRYEPDKGWKRLPDLPYATAAAPSPAPSDATGVYVLGGDDGSQVNTLPEKHRGFTKVVLRYDGKAEKWVDAGELTAPRVTVPCVRWGEHWVIPSGEVRPGIRSPEVHSLPRGVKEQP